MVEVSGWIMVVGQILRQKEARVVGIVTMIKAGITAGIAARAKTWFRVRQTTCTAITALLAVVVKYNCCSSGANLPAGEVIAGDLIGGGYGLTTVAAQILRCVKDVIGAGAGEEIVMIIGTATGGNVVGIAIGTAVPIWEPSKTSWSHARRTICIGTVALLTPGAGCNC